jgi:hypothetical protein
MNVQYTIAEALQKVNDIVDKELRISALAHLIPRYQGPIKKLLRYAYDPRLQFDVSDNVGFERSTFDEPGMLMGETRRLYIFIPGLSAPGLTREKRDKLWGELLSKIAPDDALLLEQIRQKKLPYKNLTKEVVMKAFPDLMG